METDQKTSPQDEPSKEQGEQQQRVAEAVGNATTRGAVQQSMDRRW